MSGVTQAVFMNQRSFVDPAPTVIGQAYGGGFYAGLVSTTANGVANFYLVVSPKSSGDTNRAWKNSGSPPAGVTSVIDGAQNTAVIVADGDATVYPAAHFCNNLTIGGYSDWYLPAIRELEIHYYNLKPLANNNSTLQGANPYAVPPRASNYTTTVPAQTSAAAFQSGGAESFRDAGLYWSSTQLFSPNPPIAQRFYNGYETTNPISTNAPVRAIRKVAV